MEPRELWERHTVLAKAFCQSDEEVRTAQTTLDDAQTSRIRSLAAFAVVVGNDKAVAEMLGLPEREVRIARRTVGREDARTLADDLLMTPLAQQQSGQQHVGQHEENVRVKDHPHPQQHAHAHPPVPDHMPAHDPAQMHGHPQAQVHHPQAQSQHQPQPQQAQPQQAQHQPSQHQPQPAMPPQPQHHPHEQYQQPHEHAQMYDHSHLPDQMGWSPVQDAVLVDGWQSGVDMEVLALELGTDLRRLIARAQYLSAQGRLFVHAEETVGRQGGKHRRETAPYQQQAGVSAQQMSSPGDMLLPDGLVPDGYGGYWANWNEMLPAPQG